MTSVWMESWHEQAGTPLWSENQCMATQKQYCDQACKLQPVTCQIAAIRARSAWGGWRLLVGEMDRYSIGCLGLEKLINSLLVTHQPASKASWILASCSCRIFISAPIHSEYSHAHQFGGETDTLIRDQSHLDMQRLQLAIPS